MFDATLKSQASISREAAGDALLISLALAHGLVLFLFPSIWVVAIGLWWGSNTVAHNHIHRPLFRTRALNQIFSFYLTLLLGVPQSLWKSRHLAHHAGRRAKLPKVSLLVVESVAAGALWIFFFREYLAGYFLGLVFCQLQGYFEHAGATTSHYGGLYNFLFLNDGFHVEHHRSPGTHWTSLKNARLSRAKSSRWPAIFRWLDTFTLDGLEKIALKFESVQAYLVRRHALAFREALPKLPPNCSIGIVGGGLFPRTALVFKEILPDAKITIIDMSEANLEVAREKLKHSVTWERAMFDPQKHFGFDVVVFPLALAGDRRRWYRNPPAPVTVLHDWIWNQRGASAVVSPWLLKRVNVISI